MFVLIDILPEFTFLPSNAKPRLGKDEPHQAVHPLYQRLNKRPNLMDKDIAYQLIRMDNSTDADNNSCRPQFDSTLQQFSKHQNLQPLPMFMPTNFGSAEMTYTSPPPFDISAGQSSSTSVGSPKSGTPMQVLEDGLESRVSSQDLGNVGLLSPSFRITDFRRQRPLIFHPY